MTPQFAAESLIAHGWTQSRIADAVGVAQPSIHRLLHGGMPAWDVGTKVVELAKQEKANRRRNGS